MGINVLALVNRYPNISPKILKEYKGCDDIVSYHEDDIDLKPIHISIEKLIRQIFKSFHGDMKFPVEDLLLGYDINLWHKIEGFGQPKSKQKWAPPKMPTKLVQLQKKCETLEEIYAILSEQRETFSKEIAWINNMWHYRLYGKWVFINGKPVYIPPWHWFYCSWYHLDVGLPEYRSRDRKIFIFNHYAYTTTDAVFRYRRKIANNYQYSNSESDWKKWKEDFERHPINPMEKGEWFIDMGARTCYGTNQPKHRRDGATYRAQCIKYEVMTRFTDARGGTQSMDESHSRKAFQEKFIQPWKKMPFFFKPKHSGSTNPVSKIVFEEATKKSKNSGVTISTADGLNVWIDFATTAKRGYYDGDKLRFLHLDEEGKTIEEDVSARWQVVKQSLATGNGAKISGFSPSTSTVGEMSKQGGDSYFRICQDSHFHDRDAVSGQTKSGKFNLFIPAYDGLEGFIDEFGESIIDDPKYPILNSEGRKVSVGAKSFLSTKLKNLLDKGDPESIEKWHEEMRLYPTKWRDCWISSASDSGFNIKILSERIQQLEMDERLQPVTGNFEWDIPFKSVKWIPTPTGRWEVSLVLDSSLANKWVEIDGVKYPRYPDGFVASADPFRFTKTDGRRKSNGGGAVFQKRNLIVDPEGTPKEKWKTNRFVADYDFRASDKIGYAEDMLKQCIYYGAMMYPEINVPDIWERFVEWGFGGYLLYDYDPTLGITKETPGFNSVETVKQDLFLGMAQYIEEHGARESHLRILKECLDIRGLEDMTNYDLFTAASGCLRGLKSQYARILKSHYGIGDEDDENGGNVIDYGMLLY